MATYAAFLGTTFTSRGKLITTSLAAPVALVAPSTLQARYYLEQALLRREFVPLIVGEPPQTTAELLESIESRGAYVSPDCEKREALLAAIAHVRHTCARPAHALCN